MALFQRFSARISGLALLAGGLVFIAAPASAGFEFTPPLKTVVPEGALMPEMPAVPRDSVETIELHDSAAMVEAPAPAFNPTASEQVVVSAPPPEAMPHDEIVSEPIEQAALTMPSAHENALGFGTDIPLALAMRQIVPSQYAYAFDASVDQGARITWNGGKPWDVVLSDALRPHDLGLVITDQTVRVVPEHQVTLPSPMLTAPVNEMAVAPVVTEKEPVQEVYIRRNSNGEPMAQGRAPGTTLEALPKDQPSFWSHFGLKTAKRTTTIRNTAVVLGDPSPETLPPSLPVEPSAPVMAAEMHDAPATAPMSLTTPPDEVVVQDVTAVDPYVMNFWQAEQGDSLRNVLQTWADEAGVQLFWVPASDYQLVDSVRLDGSFTEAVTQVLSAYGEDGPRPVGRLHPNLPSGPAVLIIEPSAANS
ncbi:MAG: TcpQ domain-containing protein [Micavibrio sp.]